MTSKSNSNDLYCNQQRIHIKTSKKSIYYYLSVWKKQSTNQDKLKLKNLLIHKLVDSHQIVI